jgi:hypothetical protein
MPNMKKHHVQGQCQTVNPGSPAIAIPLPQLPDTGAWSVSGTVLAFDTGATNPPLAADSLAFLLSIAGNSAGGTALRNDQGGAIPYTTVPATGGLGATISVAIGNVPGQTQTLYFTLTDGANNPSTLAWGWDLDVVSLSLP